MKDENVRPEKLGGHRVRELVEEGKKYERTHSKQEGDELMEERSKNAMTPQEAGRLGGHRVRRLVKEAEGEDVF